MSGGRKRGSAGGPGKAPPPPPAGRSAGAEKAQPPLKSPKGKKIAANNNDARADALAEAQAMAEAVADPADCDAVDGNKDGDDTRRTPSASPPPPAPSKESAKTLELNKENNAVAVLQAEKERLMKQLEKLEKEKKRKESVAAEPAPPAKRAAGQGRRSAQQIAAVSRKRLEVSFNL